MKPNATKKSKPRQKAIPNSDEVPVKKCSVCDKILRMQREDDTWRYYFCCDVPQMVSKISLWKIPKKKKSKQKGILK